MITVLLTRRFAANGTDEEAKADPHLTEAIGVVSQILETDLVLLEENEGVELDILGPGCPHSAGQHCARLWIKTHATRRQEERPPRLLAEGEADEEHAAPDGCRGPALAVRGLVAALRQLADATLREAGLRYDGLRAAHASIHKVAPPGRWPDVPPDEDSIPF